MQSKIAHVFSDHFNGGPIGNEALIQNLAGQPETATILGRNQSAEGQLAAQK